MFHCFICNKVLQQYFIIPHINTGHPVDVFMPCTGCGNSCNTPTFFGKHAKYHSLTVFQPCAQCHQSRVSFERHKRLRPWRYDIRAHKVILAPPSPHSRLDHTIEETPPSYGLCKGSAKATSICFHMCLPMEVAVLKTLPHPVQHVLLFTTLAKTL